MSDIILPEGWFREKVHTGIKDIMYFYGGAIENYPSWLTSTFTELPRYYNGNLPYKVTIDDTESREKNGERSVWIVKNLKGRWHSRFTHTYTFSLEEDAAYFKLAWG